MNSNRNNTGFTLIEMLIALAMMAMIASMVYGSYTATAQSITAYDSRLTCSERASLVLRLMARQIRSAYAPSADPNQAVSRAADREAVSRTNPGQTPGVSFEPLRAVFRGNSQGSRGEILSFTTTAGLASGSGGPQGLSQVRYGYDSITNTLWIDCGPRQTLSGRTDLTQRGRPILEHVAGVDLAFHDGQRWLTEWSGPKSRNLPRAVRIGLNLRDDRGRSYHFETTVRVFSQTTDVSMVRKQSRRERR